VWLVNTQEFYSNISDTYFSDTFGAVRSSRSFDRNLRTVVVLKMLERWAPAGCCIADLGCGPAQYAQPLLQRGHRYLGIDISEEMYRKVADLLRDDLNASFKMGSLENLPLENESIDVALSVGVIEYLTSDAKSFMEVWRTLRPGGLWIVTFPNVLNPLHAIRAISRPLVAPLIRRLAPKSRLTDTVYVSTIPHRVFLPQSLFRLAQRQGFSVKETHCHGYGVYLWNRAMTKEKLETQVRFEQWGTRFLPNLGSDFIVCLEKK
jgi:SAM-dependent methyltransferase